MITLPTAAAARAARPPPVHGAKLCSGSSRAPRGDVARCRCEASSEESERRGPAASEAGESARAEDQSSDSRGGGRFGDVSLLQTRRFWLGTSVGCVAALGGNLGGLTSSLLNANPEASRGARADLLFPVRGFKRCLEASQGFEFVYPMSWVGDQRLLYRAAARAERERSLDPPPMQSRASPRRAASGDPVVAFGPPGTDGELNVSVVVAPVDAGFTMRRLGGPEEAGELILTQFIAPDGSRKVATLWNAQQRAVEDQLYYYLEYSVKGPTFFRHNLSVYTARSGLLYSLNAQAPESDWEAVRRDFGEIADSFKLLR